MIKVTQKSVLILLSISSLKVLQILILASLTFLTGVDVAHAACELGDLDYPTGTRINLGGETLECQRDGNWKKV